jgi:hypothetical protein
MQWAVIVLICVLLFFALKPTFINLRETRDLQVCENNVRKISHALTMYMADWDGTLPQGNTWMVNAQANLTATSNTGFSVSTYFHCPLDKSGSPSSYCYNDLLQGIAPKVASKDDAIEERRKKVGNPDRMALVFEHHASAENAHMTLRTYDDLFNALTRRHVAPVPTGVIMTGSGAVERKTEEQLLNAKGKKF